MEYRVKITDSAKDDIKLILSHIEENALFSMDVLNVLNVYKKIYNKIESLRYFPKRNKLVEFEEFKRKGLRRALADPYVIFFIINQETVYVLAICYGKSDIETNLLSKIKSKETLSK